MVDYIKFVPMIAKYFNVTPDYVIQVYQHVQLTEATVWMQMSEVWAVITLIGALIFGIAFIWHDHDKESFAWGFVIGAVIVGIIALIACYIYGNYAIQMAQPEYMTWISYASQLQLAPA
jgi:drug/metabolite transporter (DMT)-like permease